MHLHQRHRRHPRTDTRMPAQLVARTRRRLGTLTLVGTMTAPGYAARVAAGAAFLDRQIPGWAQRIDLAALDLHDGCRCVLGQLGGDYFRMRDDLHLSQDATIELGFALNTDDEEFRAGWEDWAELDAAWTAEIRSRREPAQVTT